MKKENNIAYIDGQNFHLGISDDNGKIDFKKFKIYLRDKYNVEKIYYFLGFFKDENIDLYTRLQENGYIVIFKKQNENFVSKKKGNIDSDLIFSVMEKLIIDSENFDKILLVSGDGDFKILVDFLISQNRFKKILFPNKKFYSSLYKDLSGNYFDFMFKIRHKVGKNWTK